MKDVKYAILLLYLFSIYTSKKLKSKRKNNGYKLWKNESCTKKLESIEKLDDSENIKYNKLKISEELLNKMVNINKGQEEIKKRNFRFKETRAKTMGFKTKQINTFIYRLRNSSCAQSSMNSMINLAGNFANLEICNAKAMKQNWCPNPANALTDLGANDMYFLRFAYGGDHFITFANTTRKKKSIAAIQSFQGVFRGKVYYLDQETLNRYLDQIISNTNNRLIATLCLLNGPGKIKLSNKKLKAAISWFGKYRGFKNNALIYLLHTGMKTDGKNTLTKLDELPEKIDTTIINTSINLFHGEWRNDNLEVKIENLKNLMLDYC